MASASPPNSGPALPPQPGAEETAPLPEAVYTPESPVRHPGRLVAAMWADLLRSRELAWRLFIRDISAMYRQSFLGYFWAFVPPILAAVPWVFLNKQDIVSVGETGIPYPLFVLVGTMLWASFTDALNAPLKQSNAAKAMLVKINFPREALLLAGLAEALWNLIVRLLLLIPIFALFHVSLSPSIVWAPFGIGLLMLLGLSLGLLITPIGLLYTDISKAIGIVTGFGMLLTPVIYPPPESGAGALLARYNPVSPVLVTTRDWLTGQPPALLGGILWVSILTFLLLAITWFLYRLTLPILIERMGG